MKRTTQQKRFNSMHVDVIDSPDRLQTVKSQWETLWAEDQSADIFSSFDWFSTWWEHFGQNSRQDAPAIRNRGSRIRIRKQEMRLHVLTVCDGNNIVAIAPLILIQSLWRKCPVRILTSPLNSHSPRSGLIMPRCFCTSINALLSYLAKNTSWHMLMLDGIARENTILRMLGVAADREGVSWSLNGSLFHSYLSIDGTWEQYLIRKGKNLRRSMRRLENARDQIGDITIRCCRSREDIENGMDVFMQIDRKSWKASRGESIGLHPEIGNYYCDLACRFAFSGNSEVWILSVGGSPTAAYLCFRRDKTLYTLKTSYEADSPAAKYSPGAFLLSQIIQDAWRRGLTHIDFVTQTPLVDRWATGIQEFTSLTIYQKGVYPTLVQLLDRIAGKVNPIRNSLACGFKRLKRRDAMHTTSAESAGDECK
jgi:CelD/BcsL family acetyltransferase involved in cellulose biosynthesis